MIHFLYLIFSWILLWLVGFHGDYCLTYQAFKIYKNVRDTINAKFCACKRGNLVNNYDCIYLLLIDPTTKPSIIYRQEVDRVRDELSDEQKIWFDLVMPVSNLLQQTNKRQLLLLFIQR